MEYKGCILSSKTLSQLNLNMFVNTILEVVGRRDGQQQPLKCIIFWGGVLVLKNAEALSPGLDGGHL